jgi:hypothetical protein
MSDGFPLGSNDQHPPPLTTATFTACYNALAKLIDDETPHNGKYAAEVGTRNRQAAYGELGYWYKHASDGDLTKLPTTSNAPWNDLDRIRDQIGQHDADRLKADADTIEKSWQGDNGTTVHANVLTMQRKVSQYSVEPPANSGENGSYIAQVGSLLHAAYAARAAYKKDLYQIAKGARDALKAIDSSLTPTAEVGLLTLAIAGIGLTSYGSVIAGSSQIFGKVLLGNMVSQAGSLAFQQATSKLDISGDTPADVMKSASSAVNKAIENYGQACQNVSAGMDMVWNQLNNEYRSLPPGLTS